MQAQKWFVHSHNPMSSYNSGGHVREALAGERDAATTATRVSSTHSERKPPTDAEVFCLREKVSTGTALSTLVLARMFQLALDVTF